MWFLITRLVGNFAPLWFLALTYDDRLDFGDNPDGVSNSYKQVVDGTYISSILPIAKVLNYNITTEYTISSPSLTYVFFFYPLSYNLDVSDRIADPLPVPGIPVVGISPWVYSHLHLPLNSPPFLSPRERTV